MKLLLFLLLIFIATVNSQEKKFKKTQSNKYCARSLKAQTLSNGDAVQITSKAACGLKGIRSRAHGLQFLISSKKLPYFQLRYLSWKQNQKGSKGKAFIVKLGFDRFIAYKETGNATSGYQPGVDQIQGQFYLAESRRSNGAKWTKIQRKETTVDGSTKVHSLFMELKKGVSSFDNIQFGVDITPTEVEVPAANATRKKTILTPNSFKLNLNVTGIKNIPAGSTGIAIGAYLMVKGAIKRKNKTSTDAPADSERVDDATKDQGVFDVASDDDPNQSGAFFSWKKFVDSKIKGKSNELGLFVSDVKDLKVGANDGINVDSGYVLKRIYFSIPRVDMTEFLWDPSLGASEASITSGSKKVVLSVMLLLSAILSHLFLF